jgi:hypothetical protein
MPHTHFDEWIAERYETISHHFWVIDGRLEMMASRHRYVWPSELDLMARLAGMTLRERWSGWNHEAFTNESRSHISVWEQPHKG